ncbi:MAG: ABC transporter ATP-binding protein [Bacteroidetes bacterium]|nr:MAG: ABC transporter ATP-binding protein [Bacteroidota bacterium]RLD89630.1 MAG: ABC transporter ATP-binding protein [Bacteroidota bacterium]
MSLLQAINVTKSYAGHKALANVSIDVDQQSIFGLLGPNGAGKTTLIRIINMILAKDSGEILLDGKKITASDTQFIGYLPEERGLYKKMKVGEQALYLAQLKGMPKQEAYTKLKEWFDKFDIGSWWHKKVEELSKGMQQKVQFIVTVVHQPKLLIFDEPFSGFDPINVNLLKEEILKLRADGATIIFSTHNMASVEELCDHIALINNSKVILSGEINEIINRFKANIFEVTYKSPKELLLDEDGLTVLSTEKTNGTFNSRIKITGSRSPNELLQAIMHQAEITTYQEVLPSINDIFIQEVNRAKHE